MRKRQQSKMLAGAGVAIVPNEPVIELVPGKLAYLWVGNGAKNDGWCFATLSGPNELRALAKAILKEVGE